MHECRLPRSTRWCGPQGRAPLQTGTSLCYQRRKTSDEHSCTSSSGQFQVGLLCELNDCDWPFNGSLEAPAWLITQSLPFPVLLFHPSLHWCRGVPSPFRSKKNNVAHCTAPTKPSTTEPSGQVDSYLRPLNPLWTITQEMVVLRSRLLR